MHEIEIKFQVDQAQRAGVAAEVAGSSPSRRIRLQAAYFDTADRSLALARIALRVRREGRRWVQTLKGAADDGMTRFEHNVDRPGPSAGTPAVDMSLHAGTEVGRRLTDVVAAARGGGLACLYRTDVWRRTRQVRGRHGTVEMAFDEGRILAGDTSLDLCELEIELLSGSPQAVIEAARDWVGRHGLTLDTRSKSERGDMLARGERMAPPRLAQPVVVDTGPAGRAALRSCLDQISVNASQIASGEFADAHVDQWRTGLLRLRSALHALAADSNGATAIDRQAATLLSRLGQPSVDACALVRDRTTQSLLLDLLAAAI